MPRLDAPYPGSLCDVTGLKVGHFTDPRRPTGCTVVLCEAGAVAGVDVRGAAPGTRECDLLAPDNAVQQIHALLLSGGSAFGLDAATGVMRWLDERGHGLVVGPARVPIVPAAVLFDLWLGDAGVRPDAAAGYAACEAASVAAPAQGSIGAGAGATLGKMFGVAGAMKGGIGSASVQVGGVTVAALVAVNAAGDVRDPASGRLVASARDAQGVLRDSLAALLRGEATTSALAGANTTIGVVATDATLSKTQARRIATMAHDGLARSIVPVHTLSDGDVMFAIGTGRSNATLDTSVLGALGAEVTARAVLNAVWMARGVPGVPAAMERAPEG
jgi:L-aminopeptidase/D-esterase-like protein